MSCLNPKKIKNPRYKGQDWDFINAYSFRVYGVPIPPNYYITIPCGNCINCLKRKFFGYRLRLLSELKKYPNSIFVTLTFDNPSLSRFKDNPNKSLSLFLDRVRKEYGHVRHWFVAEYGKKKGRLHYHGILFNCQFDNETLERMWKYGNTFVGYANEITAKYIVKYLTKDDTKGHKVPPRIISSKGIGLDFLNSPELQVCKKTLTNYLPINGYKVPLPRYYIEKLFTEREREIISYYLYMESDLDYYVGGTRYTNKRDADEARLSLYRNYKSLGLVYSDDYEKRPRISSETKFRVYMDAYCSILNDLNHVSNFYSFEL